MTVYVDDMMLGTTVPNGRRSVTGRWSHMMADTREELDAMADKIGLRRSWIQHPGEPGTHYDVTAPKRLAALAAGAVSLPCRSEEWIEFVRNDRAKFTRICDNCARPVKLSADFQRQEHRLPGDCTEPTGGPWRPLLSDPEPTA